MENEKMSSRFGVRLSAILVAVLLVVCMSVPAFAVPVANPNDGNAPLGDLDTPSGYNYFYATDVTFPNGSKGKYVFAFRSVPDRTEFYNYDDNGSRMFLSSSVDCKMYRNSTGTWDNAWSDQYYVTSSANLPLGNFIVYDESGNVFYDPPPPPPPDFKESVSSGLTIVLDWVGATVSALFSGELAGLLPLVAVPVAITLLLVAIIVIKRSIWGA